MRTPTLLIPLVLTSLGVMVSCQQGGVVVREQVVRTEDGLVVPGPFAPKAMRIHPLTHAETDAEGNPRLVLHLELKDAWGDTVKGIGRVQAQVDREGGPAGQSEADTTRWDIDLRSLSDNASFHDPATRTYRIVLGGLPRWLAGAVAAPPTPPVAARVRVLFLTADTDGTPVVMRDEMTIRP